MTLDQLAKYAQRGLSWASAITLSGDASQDALDLMDLNLIENIDTAGKVVTVEIATVEIAKWAARRGWTVNETDRAARIRNQPPKTGEDVRGFICDLYSARRKLIRWRPGAATLDDGELEPAKLSALDDYMTDAGVCEISLLDSRIVVSAPYEGPNLIRVEGRVWTIEGARAVYTSEIEDQDVIEVLPWQPPASFNKSRDQLDGF